MNERIKELAEQATNAIPDDCPTVEQSLYLFQQKFAELIVRECADYLDAFNKENHVVEGIGGAELKKHFGVEE